MCQTLVKRETLSDVARHCQGGRRRDSHTDVRRGFARDSRGIREGFAWIRSRGFVEDSRCRWIRVGFAEDSRAFADSRRIRMLCYTQFADNTHGFADNSHAYTPVRGVNGCPGPVAHRVASERGKRPSPTRHRTAFFNSV